METDQYLSLLSSTGTAAAKESNVVDIDSDWPNNDQISAASVPHLNKVNQNLRWKLGRKNDDLNDLDKNTLIWVVTGDQQPVLSTM